jgi:uroporphyrinogen decarboxylase
MKVILHSDGKVDSFLPDLVEAGLDGIQALEATAGVDLAGLKKSLGDRLCFFGGLDSSGILCFGTPQDVEENVKKCIKAAGPGGGYFIGPSHDILNIPWENILAMRAAIEKYRNYPLNF